MEISTRQVKEKLERGEDFTMLDVRDPDERNHAMIEGSLWIPYAELKARRKEIPKSKEVIVYCHTGNTSLHAAAYLLTYDYDAKSMIGGIDEWSRKIDPKVPRY